jgi:hypothetical protein
MPVLCILSGEGFTKEQYEEIKKEVDWEHAKPKGEIFHSIGFDNSGKYHVVDIWDSEQDFNNFINNKIKPAYDKINAPVPKGEISRFIMPMLSKALNLIKSSKYLSIF